ncbi:nitroreductase family protein [Apilactobacillus ozensis]|uniref:nitroreductase family protein n=1 Tax=Apilactobacillus ozensis TaxID=866801 RepID=UPI00200A107B|nr:nitroreductase family protein [Apilactobacillus ozensis]MCK8607173.1 nitroreductase family protein [Apilactobacillus ozensis]
MDAISAINHRKSIRAFNEKVPSDEDLLEIVKAAQKSPSWINSQPARIVIAKGDKLNQIRKEHKNLNENPDIHTKSDIKFTPIKDWDIESQNNMSNKRKSDLEMFGNEFDNMKQIQANNLFDAPAVAYITLPSNYTEWSLYDAGAMGEALMIAAQDKGIDSMPAFEFIKYPDRLREHLNVKNRAFLLGIGLGFRDEGNPINKIEGNRMNLSDVVTIIK